MPSLIELLTGRQTSGNRARDPIAQDLVGMLSAFQNLPRLLNPSPLDYLPSEPEGVRPGFGLEGASIGAYGPREKMDNPNEWSYAAVPDLPQSLKLSKPVRGKSGTELVGYQWRSKIDDVYSEREGGLISKRVSDWEKKGKSTGTGRDIVHVYYVKHPDGTITEEGINSANNLLGLSNERLGRIAENAKSEQLAAASQNKRILREYEERATADPREAHFKWVDANRNNMVPGRFLEKGGRYIKLPENVITARKDILEGDGWTLLGEFVE